MPDVCKLWGKLLALFANAIHKDAHRLAESLFPSSLVIPDQVAALRLIVADLSDRLPTSAI